MLLQIYESDELDCSVVERTKIYDEENINKHFLFVYQSLTWKNNINAEVHYLEVQKEVRKKRVEKRNTEKDPAVYVFQVTDMMFNVMAPRFEALMKKSYILAARFKVNWLALGLF